MKKAQVAFVLFFALSFFGCASSKQVYDFFSMDTFCSVTVYDGIDEALLRSSVDEVIHTVEDDLTCNSGERLLKPDKNGDIVFSPSLADKISLALGVSVASEGAFDISIAPLVSLWDVKNSSVPPSAADIVKACALVGYEKINLKGNVLTLPTDMTVDLGSLGKGYCAGLLEEKLKEAGCKNALIDLGGNITAVGTRDGEPFRIGIRSPEGTGTVGILQITDCSVVTSGGYERFFEYNNVKYHHILDPFTGYPAERGLLSVTIVCKNHVLADILSTAVYVCGLQNGRELFDFYTAGDYGLTGMILLTVDGKAYVWGSIAESFDLTDTAYEKIIG